MEHAHIITKKQERQIKIRKIVFLLTIVLPLVCISFVLAASFFSVRTSMMNPQINLAVGDCEFKKNGDSPWEKAEIGIPIDEGFVFRTGPGSAIDLILQDETAVRITENSTFILENLNSRNIFIEMKSGTFYGKIKKLFRFQDFEVRTRTVLASVRGTEFSVSSGEKNYSGQCIEGKVELADDSERSFMVDRNKKLGALGTSVSDMTEDEIAALRKIMESIKLNRMLYMAENLLFETGSYTVSGVMGKELDIIYDKIKKVDGTITIIGNTDNTGDSLVNRDLSKKRADSIKDYFVEKGFDPVRLKTLGLGSEQPIYSNETEEGRRRNRRVEFVVVKE